MSDIITEAQRIMTEPNERIVFAPYDLHGDGSDKWLNVFLNGLRVGYVHFSQGDSGWAVTLNREWGSPRDVHSAVYLNRASAIERVENELAA